MKRRAAARAAETPAVPASSAAAVDRVERLTRAGLLVLVGIVVALVVYVRLRLAHAPLERDEGEYAYAGQLILKGVPPYTLVYNMKFPGTYYAYALVMAVFGQTAWGIRVGLLCVHLATSAFVFAIGWRLAGTLAGGVAAIAFAMLALDRWSMGLFAHATHFVLLPALAGLFVLDRAARSGRAASFAGAGALVGLAVVMKQQALPLAALAVVLAAWSAREAPAGERLSWWQRGSLVAAGGAAVFGALVLLVAAQGALGRFWFWTFQYAAAYVSEVPASAAVSIFGMAWAYITQATGWWWYAGIVGLIVVGLTAWAPDRKRVLLAWAAASVLAILPGLFFRPHYFILLMPAMAVSVGCAAVTIDATLARSFGAVTARALTLAAVAAALTAHGWQRASDWWSLDETTLVRSVYADNPFLEAPVIGRYLAAHTEVGDRIAVLGSEPEVFFYANRISATGYIYMYPLVEDQPFAARMRDELAREVESAKPAYLVVSGSPGSWGARAGSNLSVADWANRYSAACYDLVGIGDIDPRQGPSLRWDADARVYQPRLDSRITVFRRKPGGCQAPAIR